MHFQCSAKGPREPHLRKMANRATLQVLPSLDKRVGTGAAFKLPVQSQTLMFSDATAKNDPKCTPGHQREPVTQARIARPPAVRTRVLQDQRSL